MDDPKREEWSRHYDAIHWSAMTFFVTGAAALLGYLLGKDASGPFDLWIGLFGLWTTNMTVYFTAGYREFRRELLLGIRDEGTARFLTNADGARALSMWPAYMVTFAFLDALWIRYLWKLNLPAAVVAAVLCAVFGYFAYRRGNSVSFAEWRAAQQRQRTGVEQGASKNATHAEGLLEATEATMVGPLIESEGDGVQPSKLIANVRMTEGARRDRMTGR